jgi:hypothetical protein
MSPIASALHAEAAACQPIPRRRQLCLEQAGRPAALSPAAIETLRLVLPASDLVDQLLRPSHQRLQAGDFSRRRGRN